MTDTDIIELMGTYDDDQLARFIRAYAETALPLKRRDSDLVEELMVESAAALGHRDLFHAMVFTFAATREAVARGLQVPY